MDYILQKIEHDERSLNEITEFLRQCFPHNKKFNLPYVEWLYRDNPLGGMQGYNMRYGGKIVSHFAALPVEMNLFGARRSGLLCINVCTDPAHRGKKLFTTLGEKTAERAIDDGYEFLIATPNDNSYKGFIKYFDFYQITKLEVKIGSGKRIYDGLNKSCYTTWDDKRWRWRLNNPANRYWQGSSGLLHTPISFFAKTISKSYFEESPAEIKSKRLRLRPLTLYIGNGADTTKGLWFNIPRIIKHPPFNLVFRDLTGTMPVITKEDIFFQLIDLDSI